MLARTLRAGRARPFATMGLRVASSGTDGSSEGNQRTLGLAQRIRVYGELSKFRLSSLVVATTGAGFLAAGAPVDVPTMAAACVGTALCAGSASTFNHIIERDYDVLMNRTRLRPLPSGAVTPTEALGFGVGMGAAGTSLLLAGTNPVVTVLGAANIALYAGAYTYSKRRTELNTWIGAFVGAVPPVMGWAAATGGNLVSAEPLALGTLLFLWQFPHFFSLSWMHREDYARGGFQMVAVNDPSGSRTAGLITEYSVYLAALPIICSATGLTGSMFAVEGMAASSYLLLLAHRFRQNHSNANARRIFLCSLWYLPLLLTGFVLHNKNWDADVNENHDDSFLAVARTEGKGSDETTGSTEAIMTRTKEALKGLCVHEVLVAQPSLKSPHLCAKVAVDGGVEGIEHGVAAASAEAAAVAVAASSTPPIVQNGKE